jgi:hypothetical protein
VLAAEIVSVLVAEITPVLVAEITPVLVAEITPVLVAEITPVLAKAVAVNVTTNIPAKAMDLTFFIVCSWWFERQGHMGRLSGFAC